MLKKLYANLYPSGHLRLSVDLLKKIKYNFKSPVFAEFCLNKSKTKLIMKVKSVKYKTGSRLSKIGLGFNGIVICSRPTWRLAKMLSHYKYPVIKATEKTVVFDISKKEKYKGTNSFWRR